MKKWFVITLTSTALFVAGIAFTGKYIEQYLAHRYLQSYASTTFGEELTYEDFSRESLGKYHLHNLSIGKGKTHTANHASLVFSLNVFKRKARINISIDEIEIPLRSFLAFASVQTGNLQHKNEKHHSNIETTIQFTNGSVYGSNKQPLDLKFNIALLQGELNKAVINSQFKEIPLSLFRSLLTAAGGPFKSYKEIKGTASGSLEITALPNRRPEVDGKLAFSPIEIINNENVIAVKISPINLDLSSKKIRLEPVTIETSKCGGVINSIDDCLSISLENSRFLLKFPVLDFHPSLSSEGKITIDFNMQHATYYDKKLKLTFEDIEGLLRWNNGLITSSKLTGFLNGILLISEFQMDCNEIQNDFFSLNLDCKNYSGKFSDAQGLFSQFGNSLLHNRLPIEGNLNSIDKGIQLSYSYSPEKSFYQLMIDGELTRGELLHSSSKITLEDLSLKFHYNSQADRLSIQDLHGIVLTGIPGQVDEYSLAGDLIEFTNLTQHEANFDLWLGDRRRDIIRFVGKTKLINPLDNHSDVVITFDPLLTHFGVMHPNDFSIGLRNWSELVFLHFDGILSLPSMLHDIKRFARSSILPLSKHPLEAIDQIKKMEGQLSLQLDYSKELAIFKYDFQGKDIAIDNQPYPILRLQGVFRDGIFMVDQFALNNLSLSADIVPGPQELKIPYCGIRWGNNLNAGLKGSYNPQNSILKAHLQFAEWSPHSKIELLSLKTNDIICAEGDITLHLFNHLKGTTANGELTLFLNDEKQPISPTPLHFQTDFHTFKAQLPIEFAGNALNLNLHTTIPDFKTGELSISPLTQSNPISIAMEWQKSSHLDFRIQRMYGSLLGISFDISRELDGKYRGESKVRSKKIRIQKLDLQNVAIPQGNLQEITGKGVLEYVFLDKPNETYPTISSSQDILNQLKLNKRQFIPSTGNISFEVKNRQLVFTKFKNMNSENKLIRYSLAKMPLSTIDFDGKLSLHICLHPYNSLFKLAELTTIHIQGPLLNPTINR